MENKVFKTYRQLINILREKGMDISKGSTGSRVMRVLEQESYYNIVNGYKDLFLNKTATRLKGEDVFYPNTDFFEMKALYDFDREIRSIFLKYILKIENNFKSALSHEFSNVYGYDNYLKLENFDNKDNIKENEQKKIANITKLFGDIQQEIARQLTKKNPMLVHYMTKHGFIPLWVLVNALTLGKVTTFYFNMKQNDKVVIAKRFNINFLELHKYMSMLGFSRNKCAHDERFYDIRFTQKIHTNSIKFFSSIGIQKDKSGNYIMGISDVFSVVVIFKRMLSKSDFNDFLRALDIEFKKLSKQLKVINLTDVQNKMGFPNSWLDIKNI